MSKYSEVAGSFIRMGSYPLEANYIFESEAALKEFYNDPVNNKTLHKGLFKIVENGEDQTLYWVVKKQTNDELEFKKLIGISDISTTIADLEDLHEQLAQEIENRQIADRAIWGTNKPENIPEDLNSIIDLADQVKKLRTDLIELDSSLSSDIHRIVGTNDQHIQDYLDTLPYSSITEISETLNKFFNTVDSTNSKINTLVELNSFLEGYDDTQKLRNILNDFRNSVIGIPAPSEEFRTLRAVEDFVRKSTLEILHDLRNCHVEIDQVQVGVGLSSDGSFNPDNETYFLQNATSVMNALKTLDGKIKEILNKKDLQFSETPTTSPSVIDSVVTMNVKLSPDLKNQIIAKGTEGLYINLATEFSDGVLTVKVNDEIVGVHDLGLKSLVEDAYYDPVQENIVIEFSNSSIVKINVAQLIREWDVVNESPITLTREQVVNGTDKLSADVKLSTKTTNILKVDNGSLIVEGVTSNITHDGVTLSIVLEQIKQSLENEVTTTATELSKLQADLTALETEVETLTSDTESTITTLETTLNGKIATVTENLTTETNRALAAEQTISNNVSSEAVLRKSGDDNLGVRIDALDTKVTTLQQLINTNASNLTTIDNRLLLVQQQIESIIQLQRAHGWYEE